MCGGCGLWERCCCRVRQCPRGADALLARRRIQEREWPRSDAMRERIIWLFEGGKCKAGLETPQKPLCTDVCNGVSTKLSGRRVSNWRLSTAAAGAAGDGNDRDESEGMFGRLQGDNKRQAWQRWTMGREKDAKLLWGERSIEKRLQRMILRKASRAVPTWRHSLI